MTIVNIMCLKLNVKLNQCLKNIYLDFCTQDKISNFEKEIRNECKINRIKIISKGLSRYWCYNNKGFN